jgi:uncharacterized cysteine cluster protein YcgN (CxxCxxCC family)
MSQDDFWRTTALQDMSEAQWESLCDGCGKCCLIKLQDEDTNDIVFTDIVCDLLDQNNCQCSDYQNRTVRVPDCVKLTPENLQQVNFMPPSCAYRLLHEGHDLPDWHPLRSGGCTAMINARMSVQGRVIAESLYHDDIEERVVAWPLEL